MPSRLTPRMTALKSRERETVVTEILANWALPEFQDSKMLASIQTSAVWAFHLLAHEFGLEQFILADLFFHLWRQVLGFFGFLHLIVAPLIDGGVDIALVGDGPARARIQVGTADERKAGYEEQEGFHVGGSILWVLLCQ